MEKISYKDSKVVVIDDREEVLNSIKNALEFEEMQVKVFQNPEEGLEYLKENKEDVLLLDYFMPEMNGKEFVEKLREYNNETIIILQTGYADKVPPMEIIDMLNIQGYIDKNEGNEKLILTTKSAIKTAKLIKKLKEQEAVIESEQYRNEFMGKFLYRFIGEVHERTMVIGGLIDSITIDKHNFTDEEVNKYANTIKESLGKLTKIVRNLEFESISVLAVNELENILRSLFEVKLIMSNSNLNIKYEDNISINCDVKTIIYILVEVIDYLLENGDKEINILCEKTNCLKIKICNSIENMELIQKLNKLSKIEENVKVENEYNQVSIIIG